MFDAIIENPKPTRVTRYSLTRANVALTFGEVVDLWMEDAGFRNYYTRLLAGSPFPAYRWETPAVSKLTLHQPFQFVLLNCPEFCSRQTDWKTYEHYFTNENADEGIVSFTNLSRDAILIVPSPRTTKDVYGHLGSFLRGAPETQVDAFWRVVGNRFKSEIGNTPLWLNTAGGGVAWLHVRLDSRPKYYGYSPYTHTA